MFSCETIMKISEGPLLSVIQSVRPGGERRSFDSVDARQATGVRSRGVVS